MSKTIDLTKMTPEAVKSNVLSATATNPLTIFPMFLAMGIVAYWFIFKATIILTFIGGAVFLFGIAYFLVNYFGRYDHHANVYFSKLREENEREAKRALKQVQRFLNDRGFEQGSEQVTKLQEKMASFEAVLEKRFETGEMAYARYHQVAEQVFNNAINNLQDVVVNLEAVESIDPRYIQKRWEELEEIALDNDGLDDKQFEESESLKERFELREKHVKAAEDLLTLNEKAMTELDKFASKLAGAKTSGFDVEAELERSMKTLNKIGEEAEQHWG